MRVLSPDAAHVLLGTFLSSSWPDGDFHVAPIGPHRRFFAPELPLARTTWQARVLAHWVNPGDDQEMIVWILEWGVWPSSENYSLFYQWRQSHAVRESLEQAPCHEFWISQRHHAVDLIQLALMFGWGFLVCSKESERAILLDHDRRGVVLSPDATELDAAFRVLELKAREE